MALELLWGTVVFLGSMWFIRFFINEWKEEKQKDRELFKELAEKGLLG